MTISFSTALRNARLDAFEEAAGTSAKLEVRTGAPPANCATARTGSLLVSMTLPSDWMSAAGSGTKVKSGTWSAIATGAGALGYFSIYDSTGTTVHAQGLLDGSDMAPSVASIALGETLSIDTFILTEADAGGGGGSPGTYPTDTNIVTDHDTVPNFAKNATILSVNTGNWSDASTWDLARVPTSGDIVGICEEHTVTLDVDTAALKAVGVAGSLVVKANTTLTMIVQHFIVYGPPTLGTGNYGYFECGTESTPINAANVVTFITPDVALESSGDTAQYGNAFHFFGKVRINGAVKTPYLRTTGDVADAATSLTLTSTPTNWKSGDRLLIPDSRPLIDPVSMKPFLDEVVTLSSNVSTASASISACNDAHPAWHNDVGGVDPEWTPHVANLTRNVIFKSASADPTNVRGHVMFHGRCDIDVRYARFDSLGRTKWTAQVATGTNQKGRYPLHLHHISGPTSIPASGYQYVVKGCVIEDQSTIEQRKWGIVMHDSHYGLIQQNICYRNGGSNMYSEQGNESFNVIDGNLFCGSNGDEGRGDAQYNAANPGTEGCGLWLAGMNNYVRNNICANAASFLYGIYNGDNPETGGGHSGALIPDFQGADPDEDGHTPTNGNVTILEFLDNEGYCCDIGLNPWFIGTLYTAIEPVITQSVIEGYKSWNVKRGTFCYPTNNVKFLNCSFRVDFGQLQFSTGSYGILPVDYMQRDQILEGCEFLGCRIGIGVPLKVGDTRDANSSSQGEFLIKDCTFQCLADIYEYNFTAVTGGGDVEAPRKVTIDNPTFIPVTADTGGSTRSHFAWGWFTSNGDFPNYNWILLDETFLLNYGGNDYKIWVDQQVGTYITPQSSGSNVGSPDSGKTNTQNLADNGVCVRGEIRPGGTTTLTGISGEVEVI